jgi:hypothetical protein
MLWKDLILERSFVYLTGQPPNAQSAIFNPLLACALGPIEGACTPIQRSDRRLSSRAYMNFFISIYSFNLIFNLGLGEIMLPISTIFFFLEARVE